jgi:hypothetical protein
VERPSGGESSFTAVAIVTRTISIAAEAPTTVVVEFTVAAQWSEGALLFAAQPPYVEVARVLPAAE